MLIERGGALSMVRSSQKLAFDLIMQAEEGGRVEICQLGTELAGLSAEK